MKQLVKNNVVALRVNLHCIGGMWLVAVVLNGLSSVLCIIQVYEVCS